MYSIFSVEVIQDELMMDPEARNMQQTQNGFPNRQIKQVSRRTQQQQPQQTPSQNVSSRSKVPSESAAMRQKAYIRILEQPASKALRFRYECEGRSAGSIPGVNSTADNKTFPTVEIVGYKGKAILVASCVTKEAINGRYRPHPHNLVGKDNCKKGVCTVQVNPGTMAVTFNNLGIQCVKKKDIEHHLRMREEIRVDPYLSEYFPQPKFSIIMKRDFPYSWIRS